MNLNRDISYLKSLSGKQLREFCKYWNSGSVLDDRRHIIKIENNQEYQKGYYTQYELAERWSLYEHKYNNLVNLCDDEGTIRLKGDADQVVGLLLNLANTEQTLKHIPDREYGLVLSGGGAKGAFEIGVWRWLERSGLTRRITGISGTSVGALNSVLFSSVPLEAAEGIWRSIRQDDLTRIKQETVKKAATVLLQTLTVTAVNPANILLMAKELLPMLSETVFSQEKLSEIADRVLKKSFPEDKIVFACLARQSMQMQTEPPVDLAIGSFHNADYYCLNNRTNEDIKKIVLASAALPGVYDPLTINNFEYRDGGCRDNTPYMPLVKSGFRKLIVVHLKARVHNEPTVEMVGNSILFHVYPTLRAKSLIDTIRINEETTEEWIHNGEQAIAAQLGPYLKKGELILPEPKEHLSEKEEEMEKFDFEHFNYEDAFNEVQSEVKKPNILICGATGVGKSTLIKDIFQMGDMEGPEIGNRGRSRTTGINPYSPEGSTITLYDSQGYNIGTDERKFMKDVLGIIAEKVTKNPEDMSEHIHEVWYCVAAANNRFYEADEKMIREIRKKYKIPVMIILTKVDCVDEEAIGYLKKAILEKIPDISIFTYASEEKTAEWDEDIRKQFAQKDEIIDWALMHLDESLRAGFIPAVKKSLELKRKYISAKVIPKYAALAGGTVVATSIISVPFTDSVPLMFLQLKMSYEIIKGYGIQTEAQEIAANLLGTSAVSVIGRTLAASLVKVIPLAGNLFNATVNTAVAASVTAVLGFAVGIVCEQYLAACVENNGAENLPFAQYLNSERLKSAVNYVNSHKNEYNIQEIVKNAMKDTEA